MNVNIIAVISKLALECKECNLYGQNKDILQETGRL